MVLTEENLPVAEFLLFFYLLEQPTVRNKLLTTIPWMSAEWIISFTLKLNSDGDGNIIQFTTGDSGSRIPGVFINNHEIIYHYTGIVGGYIGRPALPLNVDNHIELHQRYVSNGKYRFFIMLNGEETHSAINNNARQFYNVKVYASNPSHHTCQGTIKNLKLTNIF